MILLLDPYHVPGTCYKRGHQVQRNFSHLRLNDDLKDPPWVKDWAILWSQACLYLCLLLTISEQLVTWEPPWAVGEEFNQTHPCLTLFFLPRPLPFHTVIRVLRLSLPSPVFALCFSFQCGAPHQVRWHLAWQAGFTTFNHQHQSNQLYPAARQVPYK